MFIIFIFLKIPIATEKIVATCQNYQTVFPILFPIYNLIATNLLPNWY